MTKPIDEAQIRQYVELLEKWKSSAIPAKEFEKQHGLKPGQLRAWQGSARRWRARLLDQSYESGKGKADHSGGFLAVRLPKQRIDNAQCVRIECQQGERSTTVHWPIDAASSLVPWLRQYLA